MPNPPIDVIARHFAQAIDKSQNLPRPEIERRQVQLLEKICRHARAQVPFYRDTKRLAPLFGPDDRFRLDGLSDVPVLTRREAQQHESALLAETIPPEMLPVSDDHTSGSTGTPLRIKRSFMQAIASQVLFDRAVGWNQCGPVKRLAVTSVVSAESREFYLQQSDADVTAGRPVTVPTHLDPREQIALIRRHAPSHVIAFPNLAEAWIANGGRDDLASLKVMFTTGEILRPETRELIERELKIRVVNFYSATETGPIALSGPDGRLRVSEETMYLEQPPGPIDPSRRVPVVATPFYAFAMPLIRYATGDYIRYSSRRPREAVGLRRIEAVLGRERSLFTRRDGTRIWPAVNADVIGEIVRLHSWQLVQETLDDVVLKIVTPDGPDAETLAACGRALEKMVPGFTLRVEVVDHIADDRASGKRFESCLSLVD